MRNAITVLSLLLAATLLLAQQDKSKRPSPPGAAEVTLSGHKIAIEYSRPKIADPKTGQPRQIYGGLVPYGKVWRTGANEATSFTTAADLDIGGTPVPKGSYTLFTLPGQDKWTLIINKQTGQWGTNYDAAQDLARIAMQVQPLPQKVEQFTIAFDKKSEDAATLNLDWENTRASVEVKLKK